MQTRGQASLVLEDDVVEVVPAQQTEGSGSRVSGTSAQKSHCKGTAKRRAGSELVMRQQVSGESQGERGLTQGQEPRRPSAPGDRHSGLQVKQGGARNCGERQSMDIDDKNKCQQVFSDRSSQTGAVRDVSPDRFCMRVPCNGISPPDRS